MQLVYWARTHVGQAQVPGGLHFMYSSWNNSCWFNVAFWACNCPSCKI